jgi:hypothetical protein
MWTYDRTFEKGKQEGITTQANAASDLIMLLDILKEKTDENMNYESVWVDMRRKHRGDDSPFKNKPLFDSYFQPFAE